MSKTKYLAIFAVAVMFLAVLAGTSHPIGGDMPDPDGNDKIPVHQTNSPPVIDGVVNVGLTWPAEAFVGYVYIANKDGGIPTAEVYMLFDNLAGYSQVDNPPAGYGPEDEQGYYFYIGIKPLSGYTIHTDGNWVIIDWDQDDKIDFDDHNGNSKTKFGYTTEYVRTCGQGVEWKIPYIDEFNGVCQSPFSILIHIEIVLPCGQETDTTTFPDRPPGHFLSAEICVGDLIDPEPPEEPGEWGLRTIGFWKHQFNTAMGYKNGHNHIPYETLMYYIGEISSQSTVEEFQELSNLVDALAILELRGKHTMREKALQQTLATWLNFVSDGDQDVDTDCDGIEDMLLSEALAFIESILTDPGATHEELELAKDMADCINNSGEE
jgi:hypothetical protein